MDTFNNSQLILHVRICTDDNDDLYRYWDSIFINLRYLTSPQKTHPTEKTPLLKPLLDAATNRNGVIGTIFSAVLNLPIITLGAVWGIIFLLNLGHINLHEASITLSIFYTSLLISSPIIGALADKVSSDKIFMTISLLLLIIVISMLILINTSNAIFYYLEFLILGIITSTCAAGYGIAITSNKPANAATATSLISIVMMGGGALFKVAQGAILKTLAWRYLATLHIPVYSLPSLKDAIGLIAVVAIATLLLVVFYFKENREQIKT